MPKKLQPGVEETILAFSKAKWTNKQILCELKSNNFNIHYNTISNVINQKGKRREAIKNNQQIRNEDSVQLTKRKVLILRILKRFTSIVLDCNLIKLTTQIRFSTSVVR